MKRRITVIIGVIIIILIVVFMVKCTNDMYYKEMTYEIISYEETPEFVKEKVESNIMLGSRIRIEGSDGPYIVIMPPEDKSVEVLFVGKDESLGYGVVYKYTYIDKVDDDIFDNIKIIKINHYDGAINSVFISHNK